ncbi:hypothetical protein LSH36_283g01003 [Paralvinella palmiformis]|uniref:Uncharacterized protein n=1 Tax=Paralvinella palmiformis TaxID=53620 RepID=A0AAD9JII6_9ANNE|nr:hypothetical protein LSH36_283g01003 [Paralvinella palmiformis]
MVSGVATFPGMKDTWDQLDRIWRVLGTPTEDVWPGVTSYPHYCREKFGLYLPQSMSRVIPKLAHIPYAETLAQELLQLQPKKRICAQNALHHKYFSDLPMSIHDIDSNTSIFDIPGIKLAPEMDEFLRTRICTNPHMKNKVL